MRIVRRNTSRPTTRITTVIPALTATSNANTVLFLLLGGAFGVSMAATILVAQHVGAQRPEAARRVVGASAAFFASIALALALVGALAADALLAAMRTPADAVPLARSYLRIIFAALPFLYLYTYVMAVLRGAGDSRTPFRFLLLSVGLDIGLNPLFIFGLGPVPRLGIAGSALATLKMARGAASVIRERLAPDGWKLLASLETQLDVDAKSFASEAEAFDAADRALVTLAAISGLAQENINRVAGWRFLDIGRRIERAINTCRFVRVFAGEHATADELITFARNQLAHYKCPRRVEFVEQLPREPSGKVRKPVLIASYSITP